jgi:hypothetical protein
MHARRSVADLSRPLFFGVVSLFWVYVTLSNVLYAWGMRESFAHVTTEPLFANWDSRVIQHLILLPCLWGAYALSLRIQWRPIWAALPLQVILALTFAALAYPAMMLAEWLMDSAMVHTHMSEHPHPMSDPMIMTLWISSLVSFLPTYGFGLALITGISLYTRFRRSELRRATAEREWSAARLAALRMQLSPHTLFLLKPFDQERFRKTLARVRPRHSASAPARAACAALGPAHPARARRAHRGAPAAARRAQRTAARARGGTCRAHRGGSQLRLDPRGPRHLSRTQHPCAGGAGVALPAHDQGQPLLPGQHELSRRGQSHAAR